MTWSLDQWMAVSLGLVFTFFLINKAPKILHGLAHQHDAFEKYGDRLRDFKYQRLVPLVDRLPISANVLTALRPPLIWLSVYSYHQQYWLGFTLAPFIVGWLTDYLDGLKARAEQDRERQRLGFGYKAPVFGKYFDPIADMIAFAIMALGCWRVYPLGVIIAFTAALGARTLLFGILLFQRRRSLTLRQRLSSDILPKTISGEMKAGIIAMSFLLALAGPNHARTLSWASWLLILAVIVEIVTLTYLVRVAIRMSRYKAVTKLQKTGSD